MDGDCTKGAAADAAIHANIIGRTHCCWFFFENSTHRQAGERVSESVPRHGPAA